MTIPRKPLLTTEDALTWADRILSDYEGKRMLRYSIALALIEAACSGAEEVYERTRSKLASAGESR